VLKRLLVANRGEIAVRVIRACREMGIEAVAVYSTADRDALHVRLADRAVCIGPPPSAKSYLVKESVITAALRTDCEAIHPGVGFLSENADFARAVREQGLVFIGPAPEAIELLGDKVRAREVAQRHGLPITPGTGAADASRAGEAVEAARALGFPVIVKAAAGGGGKGMRVVRRPEDLAESLAIASREAQANFADGTVFVEKYLENPRHVELQLLADGAGKVAVLGERDCSVQCRHQKLVEESPSPGTSRRMREEMSRGAASLFRDLGYRGAGTVEFLAKGDEFYFMEVNARVQVEHPVTEMVTGVDVIRQQILACAEGRMEIEPDAIRFDGWAVECRINALAAGKVSRLEVPGGPGVRFDSFLYAGCSVPPHYDSMLGKLLAHGADRNHALDRMDRALRELVIEGVETNIARQIRTISHPVFRSGEHGTSWYEEAQKEIEHGG